MKKIFLAILILFFYTQNTSFAIMIGTYKPETEYGLIDGFKWNFGKRENGQKFVEIKSETESEIKRVEREKFSPKNQVQSEYELFRFMEQNIVPF